jgi:hypothetical protein
MLILHADFEKGSICQYYDLKNFKNELLTFFLIFLMRRTCSKGLVKKFLYKNSGMLHSKGRNPESGSCLNFLLPNPFPGSHTNDCGSSILVIVCPKVACTWNCNFCRIFLVFTSAIRLCIRRAPSCRQRAGRHIPSSPPDRRTACSLLQQTTGCSQAGFKIGAEPRVVSFSHRGSVGYP